MLGFVKRLVAGFNVGPTQTQIGLITFDSSVYLQFHLSKYHDKVSLKNRIQATRYVLTLCLLMHGSQGGGGNSAEHEIYPAPAPAHKC